MSTGLWIALAAVVVALSFGAYRALTDGTFRGTHKVKAVAEVPAVDEPATASVWSVLGEAADGVALGERATLLQFSSAFCAPCRVTRRVLGVVTDVVPGVTHLELDAEHHLDLVRQLGVLRTPTTIVLDSAGHEVTRAAGAPRKEQVLSALASVR